MFLARCPIGDAISEMLERGYSWLGLDLDYWWWVVGVWGGGWWVVVVVVVVVVVWGVECGVAVALDIHYAVCHPVRTLTWDEVAVARLTASFAAFRLARAAWSSSSRAGVDIAHATEVGAAQRYVREAWVCA